MVDGTPGADALRRVRLLTLNLAAVAMLFLAHYVLSWAQTSDRLRADSDYAATYVGSTIVAHGQGAHLYDASTQLDVERSIGATLSGDMEMAYVNPPPAAVLARPLLAFDVAHAYLVFSMLQLLLVVVAVVIAVRVAPWPRWTPGVAKIAVALAAIAGTGTGEMLLEGQWDGVPALGVAIAYASWRRGRPFTAGLALALSFGMTKPHLGIGLLVFLLARRERHALLGLGTGAVALVATSLASVGWAGTVGFLGAPRLSSGVTPLPLEIDVTGFFAALTSDTRLPYVLGAVGGIVAAGAAGWLGHRSGVSTASLEPALAGAAALSLLMAPHLLVHDLGVLAPVLPLSAAWALSRWDGAHRWTAISVLLGVWIALVEAAFADNGNAAAFPPGRLTPLVLGAAGVLAAVVAARPRLAQTADAPRRLVGVAT